VLGLGSRIGGLEVACFLTGASALCLADVAAEDRSLTCSTPRALVVERLAWAQALSVLATFQVALVHHLSRPEPPQPAPWQVASGSLLMMVGALLRYTAVRTLGRHFVTEIRTEQLVRRGVYGRIRHPSESGLVVALTGSTLVLSSRAALAVLALVLVPVVVLRTLEEDAALAQAFGVEHDAYRREAGRFLPRLRRSWSSPARPVARTLLGDRPG
jgi:protein-S-isoprenylcysteine O-methyltransferase Ste14